MWRNIVVCLICLNAKFMNSILIHAKFLRCADRSMRFLVAIAAEPYLGAAGFVSAVNRKNCQFNCRGRASLKRDGGAQIIKSFGVTIGDARGVKRDTAIAGCNEAIRFDRKHPTSHRDRADVCRANCQYDRAFADLAAAIGRNLKSAMPYDIRDIALREQET
jgi:hypothetical protein